MLSRQECCLKSWTSGVPSGIGVVMDTEVWTASMCGLVSLISRFVVGFNSTSTRMEERHGDTTAASRLDIVCHAKPFPRNPISRVRRESHAIFMLFVFVWCDSNGMSFFYNRE
jgi:hypothetical protein